VTLNTLKAPLDLEMKTLVLFFNELIWIQLKKNSTYLKTLSRERTLRKSGSKKDK